ncbi:proton-conducting transporter transmembrane domain-containing protein [Geobacter sulfurreducens]|uniref:proton-conducting transporter transmembrane domain-containing protein n=1 Tax=Geobacter sulfurreducens TaxID=35554 RepID=UPI002572E6F4|nr:proton-conducting transporter membrane subunit [Geobacter sulfurreducens]
MTDGGGMVSPGMLLLCASALAALSGVPLLVRSLSPAAGQKMATALMLLAATIGLGGAVATLVTGRTDTFLLSWGLPFGPAEMAVDPLSAFFALPILLVAACCAVYAPGYWPARDNPRTVRSLTFFFGLLVAALIGVITARNGVLFLVAWEIMAVSAWFVLTADHGKAEVRDAGTLYLITTHIGTLALFALFSLLKGTTGSYLFPTPASLATGAGIGAGIFLTALLGFGLKAGLMPFHVWLPSAHANAPSHISAIMSGVILKLGIYGIVRTVSFFAQIPLWWGVVLLVAGMVSGIAGVAFALGQHDLKRLLAYHSIENIGIIAMGLGTALVGAATGVPSLALLGMAGALLHVLNHATFKAILFLGAGAVIHAVGTREIDRMGGIARAMPRTALLFLTGAVAICGLPPLNGFVSEFLIYLGIFREAVHGTGAAAAVTSLAGPALALVGGLAVACFVKVFGVVFLGLPRSEEAARAHEAGRPMLAPMAVLSAVCVVVGLAPAAVAPLLDAAVRSWRPELALTAPALADLAPLGWLMAAAAGTLATVAVLALLYARRLAAAPRGASPTWGCGYLAPTPRMQYTASSFAEMLVRLFGGILRPHGTRPGIRSCAPAPSELHTHVPETVLEHLYLPFITWANGKLAPVRRLQHGRLHLYILYTLITLVTLLLFGM